MNFVLAAELRGNTVHFILRLGQGDARFQFAENGECGEVAREIVVFDLGRAPKFRVAEQECFGWKQQVEIARQYADDGDILPIGTQRLADDFGVSTKAALPKAVTEDYDIGSVEDGFFREEVAAENRIDAENRE